MHHNSSFFDKSKRHVSQKIRCFIESIQSHIQDPILECTQSKRGEKFGQFIERTCVLTYEFIHIFKDTQKKEYKGSYQLEYIVTEFFNDEVSKNRFGIKFKYDTYYEDQLTKDTELYESLREALRKLTIQVDLSSRYQILEKLGEGNFAGVYKAVNKENGGLVAQKKYNSTEQEKEKNTFQKKLIMQEISMLRRIKNVDNLVKQYEVHEISNSIVLVMNLLEGGELFDVLKARDNFTWQESTTIMKQCLTGLAHLADRNIVHRDIKPENLLFNHKSKPITENQIVICDFGMATKCNQKINYQLKKCGTPGYVAPEILDQESEKNFKLDPVNDVFSMGVIFYILLTNNAPWKHVNDTEQLIQQNQEANIDTSVNNRFLREADKDVRKCLELMLKKNPKERISAKEALRLLTQIDLQCEKEKAEKADKLNLRGRETNGEKMFLNTFENPKERYNKSIDPNKYNRTTKRITNAQNTNAYESPDLHNKKESRARNSKSQAKYYKSRDTKYATTSHNTRPFPHKTSTETDENGEDQKKAKKKIDDITSRLYNSRNAKSRK